MSYIKLHRHGFRKGRLVLLLSRANEHLERGVGTMKTIFAITLGAAVLIAAVWVVAMGANPQGCKADAGNALPWLEFKACPPPHSFAQ